MGLGFFRVFFFTRQIKGKNYGTRYEVRRQYKAMRFCRFCQNSQTALVVVVGRTATASAASSAAITAASATAAAGESGEPAPSLVRVGPGNEVVSRIRAAPAADIPREASAAAGSGTACRRRGGPFLLDGLLDLGGQVRLHLLSQLNGHLRVSGLGAVDRIVHPIRNPIAIGIADIYQKWGIFTLFLRLSSRIFRHSDDFLESFLENSRVVGVHIVLLASILCCWRPYRAVGVPAVLVLLLASLYISGMLLLGPAVTGFPAFEGVLAVVSVPADPGVPILAGVFTYWILE
jgi:hypothetical protein